MMPDHEIIWQGIELRVPRSWEMTRYGARYESGACSFFDETSERFQMAWQRISLPPDLERLCSDLRSKESTAEGAPPKFLPLSESAQWVGCSIVRDENTVTRAARYFEADRILIEATIFWQARRELDLEASLLDQIRPSPASEWESWRAFGIRAELRRGMRLKSCRCLPGDVLLEFNRGDKQLPSVAIRRMAFPDIWLKEPLSDWLLKKVPAGYRVVNSSSPRPSSHPVSALLSSKRRGLMSRIYRSDSAFHCPDEKRVYHIVAEHDNTAEPFFKLRCECGDMAIAPLTPPVRTLKQQINTSFQSSKYGQANPKKPSG